MWRHRRDHIIDPRSIGAHRFEFHPQLCLAHTAGSDDLQILLVAVEIGADFEPDSIGIKKVEGIDRWGNHEQRPRVYGDPFAFSRSNISRYRSSPQANETCCIAPIAFMPLAQVHASSTGSGAMIRLPQLSV